MSWDKYKDIIQIKPTDYSSYGGQVKRWKDDSEEYPDCSSGCKWFMRMDHDCGVCSNPRSPRAGLLTWEHQAGFDCFEPEDAEQKELISRLKGDQEIVINTCYGGFGLSDEARAYYANLIGCDASEVIFCNIERDDPALVQTVKHLGSRANDPLGTALEIVKVPRDVYWHVAEYDGREWVAEDHRTWP